MHATILTQIVEDAQITTDQKLYELEKKFEEYAANEEGQLLENVAELLANSNARKKKMIIGKPLPCEHVVTVCDLYGKRGPWQIFEGSTERVRYFFTKLKKKSNNGSRIDRTVGSGTWKGQDLGDLVLDEQGSCIGRKKMLVYEKKGSAMDHGRWIMHEYGLDGSLLQETHGIQ